MKTALRHNGPLLLLAGYLFFGCVPVCVKIATSMGVNAAQGTFFRFLFSSLLILAFAASGFQRLHAENLRLLLLRGLLGGCAAFLWFLAMESTSASKGTLLNYTHSIWANVFLAVFLKQQPPRGFWPTLGLAIAGLWLVLAPGFDTVLWGDVVALASGAFGGAAVLTIKEARKTDNALSVFASFSFIGLLLSSLLVAAQSGGVSGMAALLGNESALKVLLLMGTLSTIGQLIFTQGYGHVSIALGTVMSLSVPLFATLGGWLLLGETITPRFLLGAGLVVAACAISAVLEVRSASAPAAGLEKIQ